VGETVEVCAVLHLPPGADEACLALTLSGGPERLRLELVRGEGKVRLRQRVQGPLQEVALAGPGPWALRAQVRWGLARLKAWPAGADEPGRWRAVRYLGNYLWRPGTLGGVLLALHGWIT
jgi:hypothetical protein